MAEVSDLKDIVSLSAGEYHNLFLDQHGKVYAVGSNQYGERNVSA